MAIKKANKKLPFKIFSVDDVVKKNNDYIGIHFYKIKSTITHFDDLFMRYEYYYELEELDVISSIIYSSERFLVLAPEYNDSLKYNL